VSVGRPLTADGEHGPVGVSAIEAVYGTDEHGGRVEL
jgi:hypothetical protein